jgi:hypothetical protein
MVCPVEITGFGETREGRGEKELRSDSRRHFRAAAISYRVASIVDREWGDGRDGSTHAVAVKAVSFWKYS